MHAGRAEVAPLPQRIPWLEESARTAAPAPDPATAAAQSSDELLVERTLLGEVWAFDVLQEAGFEVDSSVFPIFHERYGFQGAPRLPHRVRVNGTARLVEAPPSTVRLLGRNFPFAGGAYFRLLPYWAAKRFCQLLNRRGEPVIFYLHPWELDPGMPRFRLSPFRQLRSYANLEQTEERVARLLRDFEFGPLSEALAGWADLGVWSPRGGNEARSVASAAIAWPADPRPLE